MKTELLGTVVGGLMSIGTLILAAVGEVDPISTVGGLVVYGPLGIVSGFLLWRNREKDREHAAERQRDRDEDGKRWGEVIDELRGMNGILTRIETKIDERNRER